MVELLCVKKGTVLIVDESNLSHNHGKTDAKKEGKTHGKKEAKTHGKKEAKTHGKKKDGKNEGKGEQVYKAEQPVNVNGGSDDDASAVALAIVAGLAGIV